MKEERDPVSGERLTGHEWNGIKELDTPVPRGVLVFLILTHLFAIGWWVLMPAWPLGESYTKGLLETDQRKTIAEELVKSAADRASWERSIEAGSFDEIRANAALMSIVRSTGSRLFGDNCAGCHGSEARGRPNFPDLTDRDWLWGGDPQTIHDTIRFGVNASHPKSRVAEMPGFGVFGVNQLPAGDVRAVANYVFSLTQPDHARPSNAKRIEAGRGVFLANCATCHGEDARGKDDRGAPDLTDGNWIYGGRLEDIEATVHGGRRGIMPAWEGRLRPVETKILALYVQALSSGEQ